MEWYCSYLALFPGIPVFQFARVSLGMRLVLAPCAAICQFVVCTFTSGACSYTVWGEIFHGGGDFGIQPKTASKINFSRLRHFVYTCIQKAKFCPPPNDTSRYTVFQERQQCVHNWVGIFARQLLEIL